MILPMDGPGIISDGGRRPDRNELALRLETIHSGSHGAW